MINDVIGIICVIIITGMLSYWALKQNKDFYKEI